VIFNSYYIDMNKYSENIKNKSKKVAI